MFQLRVNACLSHCSCRARISLAALDASASLTMRHSSSLLHICDSTSVFTCDIRAQAQPVSLADAVAADVVRESSKHGVHDVVFTQALEKLQEVCLSASSSSSAAAPSSSAPVIVTQDLTTGCVNAIDSDMVLQAWQQQQQQQQSEAAAVTCAMVVKRMVSPSTAAAFVNAAAASGNWTDVMTCVRGGGVALSHCPRLVPDAAAAGQTPVMLECLLRCVDILEADVTCVLTFALHSGTPAAFQTLAAYIASAPASSASSSSSSSSAAASSAKAKRKASEKSSATGNTVASGSSDAARRALLHAALRARVSEVRAVRGRWLLIAPLCSDSVAQVSMLPLLRQMPQRAVVRLLRYLRSLMLNDCTPDASAGAGAKDSHAAPSLQRVVEWCSICMDAVGLQVGGAMRMLCFCGCVGFYFGFIFAARARVTCLQLATTQEGREICAGLKRAVQVRQCFYAQCYFVTLCRRCSSKLPSPWAASTASCSKYAIFPILPVVTHSQFSDVPCSLSPPPPSPPFPS
jgi:hypothetical protein